MPTFRKAIAIALLFALCLCLFAPAASAKKAKTSDPNAVFLANLTALDQFIRANKNAPRLSELTAQYVKRMPDMDTARLARCLTLYLDCSEGVLLQTKLEAYVADVVLVPGISDIARSGVTPEEAAARGARDRRRAGIKHARTPDSPDTTCVIGSNGVLSRGCYCSPCNSCTLTRCP